MRKRFTEIICAALASVVALGASVAAGCAPYYDGEALPGEYHTEAAAISNGGFAVQKGDYVYFINGVQSNAADNTFGKPLKGSIMRIAADDLKGHNYSSADVVVPLIAYSADHDTGIFVYGDYIYYATPSTARDADGVVQNARLDMKRTKLDGTETLKSPYVQFASNSDDYRFVEVDGTVYILYIASSETLFDESTGVTNIHSYNTATGADTLLAYNVASYAFDSREKGNATLYYTMNVRNYSTGSDYKYNQVYRVTADATEAKEYDTSKIVGWDDDSNRYINCGTLVFDGRGQMDEKTPFNSQEESANRLSYTYTLKQYVGGHLFYTRHTTQNSSEYLFDLKDGAVNGEWKPVAGNAAEDDRIKNDGSAADGYIYIFDNNNDLSSVIASENSTITVNRVKDGKLSGELSNENGYFTIVSESATLLFADGNYLYYSLSGGNGYTFNRIDYTGGWRSYEAASPDGKVNEYTPVKILDLDSVSDWYAPELLCNHLLFASETDSMATYNYIMAFDLNDGDGAMSNADIDALNDRYNGIVGEDGIIEGYNDSEKYPTDKYANLSAAAKYLFYTGDIDYVKDLAAATNAAREEDTDPVYSDATLSLLESLLAPSADNDWKDYTDTRKVNGVDVKANTRDFYYSVLGKMTEDDEEALKSDFRASLVAYPEDESVGWYDSLSTGAKVGFIVGVCAGGLLVLGCGAFVAIRLIKKSKREKEQELVPYKKRIKVDTTDDKSVNVYEDEDAGATETEGEESQGETDGEQNTQN